MRCPLRSQAPASPSSASHVAAIAPGSSRLRPCAARRRVAALAAGSVALALGSFCVAHVCGWVTLKGRTSDAEQPGLFTARRRLQGNDGGGGADGSCAENGRWRNLPWAYLTYAERNAWGELGWSDSWWDIAWEANSATASLAGRCFGGRFYIGESGTMSCGLGDVVRSYEDCKNASAEYDLAHPLDLQPLGDAIDRLRRPPGCHIQDRVGFVFNKNAFNEAVNDRSPICGFDPSTDSCPTSTTTTRTPLPNQLTPKDTIPQAVITCYGDLTREQQDAVRLLGYSIDSWHLCMLPEWSPPVCGWPAAIPKPTDPCMQRLEYLEVKYNMSEPWANLSYRSKVALADLGWAANGADWHSQETPDAYAKPFSHQPPPTGLTRKEQEAAEFLGYTEATWHLCETETECMTRLQKVDTKLKHLTWSAMPSGVRANLEVLGWTQDAWFNGELPSLYGIKWEDMRHPEKVAARKLGYSEDVWNGCEMTACLLRYEFVSKKYDYVLWDNMKQSERNAWTMLEHNKALWSQGGWPQSPLFMLRWDELNSAQKNQAQLLGFDHGSWQGCNTDWVPDHNTSVDDHHHHDDHGGEFRTVRCHMVIPQPFSQISSNVYGEKVSSMPTSFIDIFEASVARALFCGNPDYKQYDAGALDESGKPLCKDKETFERQKRRVHVVGVYEQSITVDFIIIKNQTAAEQSADFLFEALVAQLGNEFSPLAQDPDFARFFTGTTLEEVDLSDLAPEEREQVLFFERIRSQYNQSNACNLQRDAREGNIACQNDARRRGTSSLGVVLSAIFVLTQLVLSRASL